MPTFDPFIEWFFRSSGGGSERLPCTGKVAISGAVTHREKQNISPYVGYIYLLGFF